MFRTPDRARTGGYTEKRYCPFCKTKWKTIERLLEDIRVEGHVT